MGLNVFVNLIGSEKFIRNVISFTYFKQLWKPIKIIEFRNRIVYNVYWKELCQFFNEIW